MHVFLLGVEMILLVIQGSILFLLLYVFISGVASSLHGAPYVPISRRLIADILAFGGVSSGDVFFDLGCGDGRVLVSAARDFQVQKAIGYEVTSWPYRRARWRIRRSGLSSIITVYPKNLFSADLSSATVVYCYLFPKLIDRLAMKMEKELHSGARVICPSFPIDITRHPAFVLKKQQKIGRITTYLYQKI